MIMASEAFKTWRKSIQKQKQRSDAPPLSREERVALHKIRWEAKKAHATLTTAGRGGLSPSLVLHVMRRDEFRCKVCGSDGHDKGGLQVHHKGGIVESKWLSNKGHKNSPNNIVTICASCHDRIHDKARKEEVDSSQKEPTGDKESSHG